ncbi:hypothetical protein AB0O31_03260 [Kitasatospora cineracea]|uniref:hypothetical protein n=1 Tax=Kitasatospora cineracea TaxID=88074 RepID=UPI003429CDCC
MTDHSPSEIIGRMALLTLDFPRAHRILDLANELETATRNKALAEAADIASDERSRLDEMGEHQVARGASCAAARIRRAARTAPPQLGDTTALTYRASLATQEPAYALSYGHDAAWTGTQQQLADAVAARLRTTHPGAHGSDLVVNVWPTREDEHYRLPVPAAAVEVRYPDPTRGDTARTGQEG